MLSAPLLRILVAIVLVAAACASEPTADERAAARAALLGDAAPERQTGADPSAEEVEQPTDAAAPRSSGGPVDRDRIDRALASVPDDGLRFQLATTLGLAEAASAACGDLTNWAAAMDEASQATTIAASTTREVGGSWVGSDDADVIAAGFRDTLVLQTGCAAGGGDGDVQAAMAAAGRASAANDDVLLALTGREPATGSDFWYHADEVGQTIEIERLVREEGPVEVLVVGSSTTKRGFDPGLMTTGLGRSTMNAGVAGLFPTTLAGWTDVAVGLAGEPGTVVVGVSTFQDFLECTDDRQRKMAEARTLQMLAFAALDALAAEEPALRLTGGSSATYRSPVLDEYTPLPGARGQMASPDVPNPESVEFYNQLYTPRMANAEYCPQNAPAVERVVTDLVEAGREVLVVSLPLHPGMADLHPGGRAAHDQSVEAYRAVAAATGAAWLDLTDLLGEDEFLDLTHATSGGRTKITAATIEALS